MKKMKPWGALVLVLLLALTLSLGVAAKEQPPVHLTYDLTSSQTIQRNVILNSSKVSTITTGTVIVLEEGYTMTVYGQLSIDGTFINKGTVRVVASDTYRALPGVIENRGTFTNFGTLQVKEGTVRNRAGSKTTNGGTIVISGETEDRTYFSNLKGTAFEGVAKPALLTNTGTIRMESTKGISVYNTGTIENTGTIQGAEGAVYYGISLSAPETTIPADKAEPLEEPAAVSSGETTPAATPAPTPNPTPAAQEEQTPSTPLPAQENSDPKAAEKAFQRFVQGGNTGQM